MSVNQGQRAKCEQQTLAEMLGVTASYLSNATRGNWLAGGDLKAPVAEWVVWNRKKTMVSHYSVPMGWLNDRDRLDYISQNIDPGCDLIFGTEKSVYESGWLYITVAPVWADDAAFLIWRVGIDRPA